MNTTVQMRYKSDTRFMKYYHLKRYNQTNTSFIAPTTTCHVAMHGPRAANFGASDMAAQGLPTKHTRETKALPNS